jgi:hypothetical protein
MRKACLFAGPLLLALVTPALAQERIYRTQAGQRTVIADHFTCADWARHNQWGITGRAWNGTVTVEPGTLPRCGKKSHPVTMIYYTPKPGFRGTDKAVLYGPGLRDEWRTIVVE